MPSVICFTFFHQAQYRRPTMLHKHSCTGIPNNHTGWLNCSMQSQQTKKSKNLSVSWIYIIFEQTETKDQLRRKEEVMQKKVLTIELWNFLFFVGCLNYWSKAKQDLSHLVTVRNIHVKRSMSSFKWKVFVLFSVNLRSKAATLVLYLEHDSSLI